MSQTFLVSRVDAIGDVVLTLPVCGMLKQLFPGCRVVLVGRSYTAAVAAACPWVDEFVELDKQIETGTLPTGPLLAQLRSYSAACSLSQASEYPHPHWHPQSAVSLAYL
jgi:heptosyltransferase-3